MGRTARAGRPRLAFGLLYYNRRSTQHDADVLFPLFWNLRDEDAHTTVVGPFMHREAPANTTTGSPPLLQRLAAGGGYLHIRRS